MGNPCFGEGWREEGEILGNGPAVTCSQATPRHPAFPMHTSRGRDLSRRLLRVLGETDMLDFGLLAAAVVFFALSLAYVRGCDRL